MVAYTQLVLLVLLVATFVNLSACPAAAAKSSPLTDRKKGRKKTTAMIKMPELQSRKIRRPSVAAAEHQYWLQLDIPDVLNPLLPIASFRS